MLGELTQGERCGELTVRWESVTRSGCGSVCRGVRGSRREREDVIGVCGALLPTVMDVMDV